MGNKNSAHDFSFTRTQKRKNVHFAKSITPDSHFNPLSSKRINANFPSSHSIGIPGKTSWPSPHRETVFLPEFKMRSKFSFSDFDTVKKVGKGGFGHVLKVIHQASSEIYALKVIDKAEVIRLKATKQCKDEISIHSKLDSPYITQCFYAWQTKRHLYILMQLAERGDLFSVWVRQRQLPVELVKFYLAEISIGLDYLHKSDIIFRDLKLENILLDKNEHVLISDFGLSKKLEVGERTRTICGTMQYMAPEILGGYHYGHEIDYWALGIIMYTLLMGCYPFKSEKNHIQMYHKVATTGPTYSKQLDIHTISLITALLNPNQKQRISKSNVLQSQPFFKTIDFYRLHTRQKLRVLKCQEYSNFESKIGIKSKINEMITKEKFEILSRDDKVNYEFNKTALCELRENKKSQTSVKLDKPNHWHLGNKANFNEIRCSKISFEYYPIVDSVSKVGTSVGKGTKNETSDQDHFYHWL